MLGSDQSCRSTFRCLRSVLSPTSTRNYLAGPHHQQRGPWTHWSTCCQRDHISAKTVHARPRVENATFSRRLQSHLTFLRTGGDDPVDLDSPGWLPYTGICSNSILTWTMFLNLLPIVYCGGGWFVPLRTTLVHTTDYDDRHWLHWNRG